MNITKNIYKAILQLDTQIRWIAIIVIVSILSTFLFGQDHLKDSFRGALIQKKVVQVISANKQINKVEFIRDAAITARTRVDIVPQASGRIIKIFKHHGDSFKADEVLFLIENHQAQQLYAQARAEFLRQEIDANLAQEEYKIIHPDHKISELASQKLQLEAAYAKMQYAKIQLNRTAYSLPFAGIISNHNLHLGQYANAGKSYGNAYAIESLEAIILMPKEQAAIISIGAQVEFMDGTSGKVSRIGAHLDNRTKHRYIFVALDESSKFQHNLILEAKIYAGHLENTWAVPVSTLNEKGFVWEVKEGVLLRKSVEVIFIENGTAYLKATQPQITMTVEGSLSWAIEGMKILIHN